MHGRHLHRQTRGEEGGEINMLILIVKRGFKNRPEGNSSIIHQPNQLKPFIR